MARRSERGTLHIAFARKDTIDIVKTCDAIEGRRFNPFLLDVKYALSILKKYFPHLKEFEDHCLDASALNHLSKVLRLQGSQLRFQSSSLYADPAFLEEKIPALSTKNLAQIFAESWHPIVELEQITEQSMSEATEYWNALAPIEERWKRLRLGESVLPGSLAGDKLSEMGIQAEELFGEKLLRLWRELREEAKDKTIGYQNFVCRESFPETVERALLVSFLVTYGYARISKSKGVLQLLPNKEQRIERRSVSLPISITQEVWSKWKEKPRSSGSTETS